MIGAMLSHASWSHVLGNMIALVRFQNSLSYSYRLSSTSIFLILFVGGSFAGFFLNHTLIDTFVDDINSLIKEVTDPYKCSHWLCTNTGFNTIVELGGSALVNIANLSENVYIYRGKYVRRLGASGGVYSVIAASLAFQIHTILFGNGLPSLFSFSNIIGNLFQLIYLYTNGLDLYNEVKNVPFTLSGLKEALKNNYSSAYDGVDHVAHSGGIFFALGLLLILQIFFYVGIW
jgi:membrane associated rhomboid family serine protease